MEILNLLEKPDTDITSEYIMQWEKYLTLNDIKNNINEIEIDTEYRFIYKGNFFKLLKEVLLIDKSLFPVYLMINGYSSPMDYQGESFIKYIDPKILMDIKSIVEEEAEL